VTKHYGKREALKGVDFSAAPGELVAIIGPNGAGKTTLLSILAGTLRPDGGTVDSPNGDVGWVPQQAALYRRLTVEENLLLFARLEGRDDPRGRGVDPPRTRGDDLGAARAGRHAPRAGPGGDRRHGAERRRSGPAGARRGGPPSDDGHRRRGRDWVVRIARAGGEICGHARRPRVAALYSSLVRSAKLCGVEPEPTWARRIAERSAIRAGHTAS